MSEIELKRVRFVDNSRRKDMHVAELRVTNFIFAVAALNVGTTIGVGTPTVMTVKEGK